MRYVSEVGFVCDECADKYLLSDLRQLLPDYVYHWVNKHKPKHTLGVLLAIAARHERRFRIEHHRSFGWRDRDDLERVEACFDTHVNEHDYLAAFRVIDGLDVSDLSNDEYDPDGLHCECGYELEEPRSIGDVVQDYWPKWARDLYQDMPPGPDDEFFWKVAEAMGEVSRSVFANSRESSIEEAIQRVVVLSLVEAMPKVETLVDNDGRGYRLTACGGTYKAGCFTGDIGAARKRWSPELRPNHPNPEAAAKLLAACEEHHARKEEA